ncbi:MAG: heavy metal translocating P-type ATPase, partial [Gemmatimonadaceae bacterium]
MLDVPAGVVEPDASRQFCCTGCRTAFAILHSHGLQRYYDLAERTPARVKTSGRSFEEFDHPAFAAQYVQQPAGQLARTELYLEGVHCASCVWLVERVPLLIPGVARAELDVRRSRATVEWDAGITTLSQIARTLDQLGYTPHPFRGVARTAMRMREDRAMLTRIGVAGAIAINIMLAALALYAGEANHMDASMTRFFRWVSLGLIVPAFIWPGRVFFTGAIAALRTRSLHMDLPIALALSAGLVRGAINTIRGSGPIYYDGLAVLIFALLVGRFLQQRGQRMAADSSEAMQSIAPMSARVVDEQFGADVVRDVPIEALLPGMTIDVRSGETFAADGVVLSGRSAVNAALLTGESRPVTTSTGDLVYAGTLNISAPLRVRVQQAGESSRIARLFQQVEASAQRRAPVVVFANRLAGIFVAVVVVAALVTYAIKTVLNAPHALDDAIALLIVTCPCALALATPLTITVAVGRAAKRGLLIKGGDALELLATPSVLVLDKTGTITEGHTTLVSWRGPEWVKVLVLSLESGSSHPLAEGFRRAWPALQTREVTESNYVAGGGIEGTVDGHHVVVGSPRFAATFRAVSDRVLVSPHVFVDATLTPVHVVVDGVLIATAGFGDRVRDDAAASLAKLRSAGWRTIMLSGDAREVADTVGHALGFADADIHAEATPEDKLAFVELLKKSDRVVMVGDGVNDAAAIAAADVGIGVHGGAEACLSIADIYLTTPGLGPLVELMQGARRAMRVIRRNILCSVAYNGIGASLAVAGVLTPLIAAVLMPLSSLTVVFGAWYGTTFSR